MDVRNFYELEAQKVLSDSDSPSKRGIFSPVIYKGKIKTAD